MKVIYRFLFFLFIIPLFPGCHDKIMQEQTFYEPVYLSFDDLRKPIQVTSSDTLQKPGKIYIKDQLIFINEYMKGIHVIDNTDPTHPVHLAFIGIPGNVDMAVRGNILYADSYVDLVSLDISDPHHIVEKSRAKNILPYAIPATDGKYPIDNENIDQDKGVIIRWEVKKVVREIHYNPNPWPWPIYLNYENLKFTTDGGPAYLLNSGEGGVSTGTGGSMARFTLYDKWLYVLSNNKLIIIRVDNPVQMFKENEQWVQNGMETIFRHDDKLFFGSQTGMLIYDLSDPLLPAYISSYNHIRSCDPVIVQGDYAFVTLRAGNGCGSTLNRLEVIDISDMVHPVLKRSYVMENPYGLAIQDSLLFVCDGDAGLKMMNNANDPLHMFVKAAYAGVHAYDVIPLASSLLMIGRNGLFQYEVQSQSQLKLLSSITVEKP